MKIGFDLYRLGVFLNASKKASLASSPESVFASSLSRLSRLTKAQPIAFLASFDNLTFRFIIPLSSSSDEDPVINTA